MAVLHLNTDWRGNERVNRHQTQMKICVGGPYGWLNCMLDHKYSTFIFKLVLMIDLLPHA